MVRRFLLGLVLSVFFALGANSIGFAQEINPGPLPSVLPPLPKPGEKIPFFDDKDTTPLFDPIPKSLNQTGYPPEGSDGIYPINSAILYREQDAPGWYGGAEIQLIKPHLSSRLTTPYPVNTNNPNNVSIPVSPLDWTGVPRLGIGYRLDQGKGDIYLDYRLIASSGSSTLPNYDALGSGFLHSRLNVNSIDLSYISSEILPLTTGIEDRQAFKRDLRTGFGIRAMSAFFDTQATGQQITDTHISSMFYGVGPSMQVLFDQQIADYPIWLHTKLMVAGVIGSIQQEFSQTGSLAGQNISGGYNTGRISNAFGDGAIELGLSWTPEFRGKPLRLTVGYTFERIWNFGATNDSNAELTLQGIFFRTEYRY